jgi:spore maturation protein CgeB
MKIVVIGKKNLLHWDDYVSEAFEKLGHDVYHFQINKRPLLIKIYRGISKTILGKKIGNKVTDSIYANKLTTKIKNIKPDLIFYTSASFIPEEFYKIAGRCESQPKLFAWDCDGGAAHPDNKYLSKYIDIFFDTEIEYVKLNPANFKKVVNLSFCANTNIYKDLKLKRNNSFYICGALTKERDAIFSKLIDFNIVFKGFNWDKLSTKSHNFKIKIGSVSPEEQAIDYNSHIGVINIHQVSNNPLSALNMRTFEAPASNSLLISDYREGIEKYFEIGREILCYKNKDELKKILSEITQSPDSFNMIRDAGYRRAIKDHTYLARMKEVLSYI